MKSLPPLISTLLIASAALAMASPYDLDIAAPVQIAGSDETSAAFQKNVPALEELVKQNLSVAQAVKDLSASTLDPNNLTLKGDSSVRVYFIGEGAGYANTLGFSTTGGGPLSEDAALIFPNASSSAGWGSTERAGWAPLQPGDFVDLGIFKAGTKLDFFLIADGSNGGKEVFSTSDAENKDGLAHAVTLAPDGSTYWLVGFEDIFGESFKQFNDLVFAVQVTPANTAHISAPEPTLALGAVFACGAVLASRRRRAKA